MKNHANKIAAGNRHRPFSFDGTMKFGHHHCSQRPAPVAVPELRRWADISWVERRRLRSCPSSRWEGFHLGGKGIEVPNQITAHNAGWRLLFRYRGSRHRPGVCEFNR